MDRTPAPGYKDNSYKIAVIYAMYYAEIGRLDLSRHWLDRMKALRELIRLLTLNKIATG